MKLKLFLWRNTEKICGRLSEMKTRRKWIILIGIIMGFIVFVLQFGLITF